MNITSSPTPYASAVEPLLYTLEGLDPDVVTTVEIIKTDNGATLGTLRLKGLAKRSIDIAPYLRRHFVLDPVTNSATYPVGHPDSIINCHIRIGDIESQNLPATLAAPHNSPLAHDELLSDKPLNRTLAAGESDDLRVISEDGTITASILLHDTNGGVTPYTISSEEREQMVGVVIDFDSLQARISAPLKRIDVTLSTSAKQVATIHYDIVERGVASHRVAWFNSLGACDLHTFEGCGGRKVSIERSRIAGSADPLTLRRTTITLDSGIMPRGALDALLSLLASPAVWLVVGKRLRQVEVTTTDYSSQLAGRPDRLVVQLSYAETISRTV